MLFERLFYELKLRWITMVLVPCLILISVVIMAYIMYLFHADPSRLLLSELEMFLPLAASVIIGSIITQEPALELQLTLPRKYHNTGIIRTGIVLVWTACVAVCSLGIMVAFRLFMLPGFTLSWPVVVRFFMMQLIWLAPLLWFAMLGLCCAVLTKSMAACSTILGIVWLIDFASTGFIAENAWLRPFLLFPTFTFYPIFPQISQRDFTTYWLTTRFENLIMALVLFPIGWLLLHNTERLLQAALEE